MISYSLFSATGCMRCKIVKSYLIENNINYQEFDFKADGKEEFQAFYRKNRSNIFRGEDGVEFPLLFDGEKVIQGVGVIIAFLIEKKLLEEYVTRSDLSHGWVSGLNISAGDEDLGNAFITVVTFLKAHGLQTQIETDGRNSVVLKKMVDKSLVDRLIFYLYGPADLYEAITGTEADTKMLCQGLACLEKCGEYQIILPIRLFRRERDKQDVITPEEAGRAASFVEQSTGKKTHHFYIKDDICSDEKKAFGTLNLFQYRTACRRYMVKSDLLKIT